jgi:hypothetical protein
MKKNIILFALIIMVSACASEFKIVESDVPPAVMTAFKAKYPNSQDVEWEAEKTGGHLAFEAEFKMDGKSKEAYFKPDGTFLKEE